jgi:hypothetical protein
MDAVRLAQLLRQIPEDNPKGYDEAGYVAKYGVPAPYNSLQDYQDATGRHLNDEFKMPNHQTFSSGSIYSAPDMLGGNWQKGGADENLWNYQPSDTNFRQQSPDDMANYFATREAKKTFVTLPDGRIVEGSL